MSINAKSFHDVTLLVKNSVAELGAFYTKMGF